MTNSTSAVLKAKAELGVVPSYKEVGIPNKLVTLAAKHKLASTNEKKWKQEKDELAAEIGVELGKAGVSAVLAGKYKVSLVDSHNSSIDKEQLLESGVPAETIVECTKITPYSYVLVTDMEKAQEKAQTARKEKQAGVKNIAVAKKSHK